MPLQSVSPDLLQSPQETISYTQTDISSPPDVSSAALHPLLLVFYLIGTCFCLIMAYLIDSNWRSNKTKGLTSNSEEIPTMRNQSAIQADPGEWVRPLGNLETFMEIGGEYGTLNTVQAIWLSSKEQIRTQDVLQAITLVAKKTHIFQVCVEWRGMRPWFRRMKDFAIDFEVEEDDYMAVFYTQLQQHYDMTKGPLWSSRLVPLPKESSSDDHYRAVLMVSAHHSITDGHTNMSFCRDVMEVLNASMTGRTYEIPLRPIIAAMSDSLLTKKNWYYIFRYFFTKLYKALIIDFNTKAYFRGALEQPRTKVALTKVLRENFTVEETKELVRHCKAAGVSINSCILTTANLALLQTAKQRARYRVEAAHINTVNCINMRRYFGPEMKGAAGCHISLEEKENLIPCNAAHSKEHFWSLAKLFQKNLNDSLNVLHTPIRVAPLFRTSSILLHINRELTKRGRKNCTDNHMISTNMGNLKDLLPGKYNGPVEITDIQRSVSSELTGNPFTLVFHTFNDRFMISIDYYTNKITDDCATQFFNNLVTYIGNISRYGTVQRPLGFQNGSMSNVQKRAVDKPIENGVSHTADNMHQTQ